MRIFVTGGTGYIGSAVVHALVGAGHEVTGLVRPAKAGQIEAMRATPAVGDLADPSTYAAAAGKHDAVVHAAFEQGPEGPAVDRRAVEALLAAASSDGPVRSLVFTSGVWVLGDTGDIPADEDTSTASPALAAAWRPAHERLVLDGATDRLATAVIRPGMVYGGKAGIVSGLFASAVREGAAAFVGGGENRWSFVHREDAAALYRLVVERLARGVFHGVDGVPMRVVDAAAAASLAAGRGGAVRSIPVEDARADMGPVADALCLDQVVVTRRSAGLGWRPRRRSFAESASEAYEEWRA